MIITFMMERIQWAQSWLFGYYLLFVVIVGIAVMWI
jgi:hypothetical protein